MITIPTLSGPSQPAASGITKQLIILLHGVGADGNDLFGLAPILAEQLPDAAFVSPNAPFPCDMAPYGYQWFSLQSRAEEDLLAGVQTAAPILNHFIDIQMQEHGVTAAQTALLGFSQGTMTALYTALRRPDRLACLVGFSGAMVAAARLPREAKAKPPVCLIHGDRDMVVPFAAMEIAERSLHAADVPVETHRRSGLGHGIDAQGLEIATRFLREHLAVSK